MNVKVVNNSGLCLIVPKETPLAYLLLMEWIAKEPVQCTIRVVNKSDSIQVRIPRLILESYLDCRDYINANL